MTFVYFLCVVQSEEDLWKFQVEAQRAYTCKQILGLGHSPPRMENQVKVEQKNPKSFVGQKKIRTRVMVTDKRVCLRV